MVKEQKTTGTQNRSTRGRKYGRRILCLILALVFTLTGLPTGGVEEAKAARDISSFMLGEFISGKWDDATKTLTVNGTGTADEFWVYSCGAGINGDWTYIKENVEKIVFGKQIDGVKRFFDMPNLQTIQFNNPNGVTLDEEAYTFRYLTALTKVILPPGVSDSAKDQITKYIKDNSGATASSSISFERQYTINVLSGEFTEDNSNKQVITTSEESETRKLDIKADVRNDVIFDKWVVKNDQNAVIGSTEGVEWLNNTETCSSAALKLTFSSNTPPTIYVAATFKKKENINYQTALEKIWLQVRDYHHDQELDEAPTKGKVEDSLKALLNGMSEMAGGIFNSFIVNVSDPTVTQATTQASGSALYNVTLSATPVVTSEAAVTTSGALSFKLKQKEDRSYTVVVDGGTCAGPTGSVSGSSIIYSYLLSDIENASGSLPITITSTDRTAEGLYYDGWTVEPNTVALTGNTDSTGYYATGNATLTLTENSPSLIRVTAKYKTRSTYGGGGGWIPTTPTTPTTPEKPKDEEKPKDPEKPTDTEQPAEDPAPAPKPISTTTKTNTATVSVSDLQKAVDDETNAGMTIKYQNATLTFDAKAVESIVKQAKKIDSSTLKVVCKADAQSSLNSAQKKALKSKTVIGCYQVYLKCGSKTISDFGKGKVKVKVPLKLKSGQKSKNVKLYYVDEKGKLTKQTASYSNGKLTFTTTHFSIYAAIYPKQTTTTASDKTNTSDKTSTTDKTKKPTQVIGKKNETVPGGVVDDSMIGLPKAEENEVISYQTLQLHLSRSDDTSVRLGWNQVPGASGYELYGARCNTKTKKYEIMQITTLDAPTMTAWMCENLKENTYYKFIVRAYMKKDGEKVYIARSRSAHVSTGGGGYGFIQDVTVDKPEVTLGVGKTSVIKATIDTAAQKIRSHYDLRFESSDSSVATVSGGGKITAKKKGTCTIYVYTQNGLYTTVKVTVK